MLPHVSQTSAIIVPIPTEGIMDPVRIVGSVRCRSKPSVIVQILWYRFRLKVSSSYPEKLPIETRQSSHGHFERPAEHAGVHQLFDLLDFRIHSIKIRIEAEPSV